MVASIEAVQIIRRTAGADPQIAYTQFDSARATSQQVVVFLNGAAHLQNCWQQVAESLAQGGQRCVTLDYRGHGESTWSQPVQQATLDHDAEDVAAVLEAIGLDSSQCILVGHSLGGGVAQRYAEHHEVAGLVIVASMAFGVWMRAVWHSLPLQFIRHPRVYPKLRTDPSALFPTPALAREYLFGKNAPGDLVERYLRECWCHESGKAFSDLIRAKPQPLRTRHCWLVAGRQDASVALRWMLKSAARLHAPLLVVEGPHDLMLVEWQRVADAVWAITQHISFAQQEQTP